MNYQRTTIFSEHSKIVLRDQINEYCDNVGEDVSFMLSDYIDNPENRDDFWDEFMEYINDIDLLD